ncbi:tectonic-3-like [Syngnathoides biaculeatus]|uniref:tectonic-3-like n=1 Tax=Syngnathoides biaculeatus TaxID=300417 RepID=UPI002ADE2974|nr:tectonic-3-like [Syngnathoides biaculeatus]
MINSRPGPCLLCEMNMRHWVRLSLALVVFAVGFLTQAGTTAPPTDGQPVSSATPSPGVTEGLKTTTPVPGTNDSVNVTGEGSGNPFESTPSPTTNTGQFVRLPEACVCDLTPNFCDIGCCCDTADCGVADLTTVFTGCPQKAASGVCIEKWLMFRANVDSSLVSVTESLFCVQSAVEHVEVPTVPLELPVLGDSYHFSPPQPISVGHSRHFYRADDVIQTVFTKSSVRGLLRQPSPGVAGASCLSRNPARFLRSESLSCTRMVTPQSCTQDPNLSAHSYFTDLRLIKIPKPAEEQVSDILIPITPLSDWPAPKEQNNLCVNVAKKVEFVIVYTSRGELASATVNVVLADVKMNQLLHQVHSVQYKLGTPRPSPMPTIPSVGLRVGASVLGGYNGQVKAVTIMGVPQAGECSADPATRTNILFTYNTITGCVFSSPSRNCTELRSEIDSILLGDAVPDVIAMSSGSQPDWTRVLEQECPVSLEETCDTGCTLPHLLSVQVLWARMGLLDLPQSYILGVKYVFRCRRFQCPLPSTVILTTEVAFADMTVYPKTVLGTAFT